MEMEVPIRGRLGVLTRQGQCEQLNPSGLIPLSDVDHGSVPGGG